MLRICIFIIIALISAPSFCFEERYTPNEKTHGLITKPDNVLAGKTNIVKEPVVNRKTPDRTVEERIQYNRNESEEKIRNQKERDKKIEKFIQNVQEDGWPVDVDQKINVHPKSKPKKK